MKIRWREHEIILASGIALFAIKGYIWKMLRLTPSEMNHIHEAFIKNHIQFNYFSRILLPQIGCIVLLWLCYMWINRFIIPAITRRSSRLPFIILGAIAQLFIISYIIGPGINFISFYAVPFQNPSPFVYFPLTFGFHPQPLLNSMGGLNDAFFLLGVYTTYAIFREFAIRYIENNKTKAAYRTMVLNQCTLFLVVFFAVPIFVSIFGLVTDNIYFSYYFAFFPPMQAVFVINTYKLFPENGERPLFKWRLMGPLMFYSFMYTIGCSIFLQDNWSIGIVLLLWALQLLITTPASWLNYQQKKDKILQLKGFEKALAKSTADLQFLRSQINPHFLFNALNTLYGTALIEKSERTAEGIQKLGDMMRFMLHENMQDLIPMEKEIEYLKNYISLQKLRVQMSPDIIIEDNIKEQDCNYKIAPMLLIPFVENAFKHGISLSERSWINIKLECDDKQINFEVRNSVHRSVKNDPEKENTGIGLQNVRERLLILYPGKHRFCYGVEGDEFVSSLTIQTEK